MSAQPRNQEVDGEPVRGRTPPDGLYRYQPMPPAYRDADGYLVEDSMGRNSRHMCETSLWYHALTVRLPAATVCSNLFLHYRKGDRGATLVPDLFVALGVPPIEDRDNYKLWQDPVPDLAMEMLADSTTANDECSKRDTYERLGAREYWLFDPSGFKLATPLAGYRLREGRYRPIDPDAAGRRRSKVLELDLHVQAGELRFRDPATGENLRTYSEALDRADAEERRWAFQKARADAEERRWAVEKARADAAERELARLRLRLEDS